MAHTFMIGRPQVEHLQLLDGQSFGLSAFDVPRSAACQFDRGTKRLVIRFMYPDDESGRRATLTEGVTAEVGRHSGKILLIAVDVPRHADESAVVRLIQKALTKQIPNLTRFNEKANYELVSSAIFENRSDVAKCVASDE